MAFSHDLFQWNKYDGNPVFQPINSEWAHWGKDRPSSCRDPHIHVEDNRYYLYYTAVKATGESCIALAISDDLVNWEDQGSIFSLRSDYSVSWDYPGPEHVESACVHKMEDEYYLFYGFKGGVRYNKSSALDWFEDREGDMIWEGYTGMEVVVKKGHEWLVSAFKYSQDQSNDSRFFLGIIDWSTQQPKVNLVTEKLQLKPFL
jgi:sucrose-6-phosphate hydrolase SacC (GH32 family)